MPVHKPGKVLLHHIPLKFVHDRVAGGGRKSLDQSIPLVPFIDFLITLVVFLLMSFSSTGELVAQKKDIVMPKAMEENTEALEQLPIISVSGKGNYVMFNDKRVADYETLKAEAALEPIDKLVSMLEDTKRTWKQHHPKEPDLTAVVLQSDEDVDVRVIKKVMRSAAMAGVPDISFAVGVKAKATAAE